MVKNNVCLQINFAPGDIRYVMTLLPHQLRTLGRQVEEIQFTLDTKQSQAFRYSTDGYSEKLARLRDFLQRICAEYTQASIVEVDYSLPRVAVVARSFTDSERMPLNACDGSAFYAYLYGLYNARSDFVFHIDSDMLFGGGSQNWVAEALELLGAHKDILACYPFAGPPRADGVACKRRLTSLWNDVSFEQTCLPSDRQRGAYNYNEITTRAFLLDRRRFLSGELRIPMVRPRLRRTLRSLLVNTPPYLLLEDCLTILMNRTGLCGIAFLGSGNGLWSLHPSYRSERFYVELPDLVRRIEENDVPDSQRGDFGLNDSMIDWSDVHGKQTRWHRLRRDMRLTFSGIADRVLGS